MRNNNLTDAQVDTEIERLNASPLVQLARKERNIRYKRRLEQRGKQLADQGYTLDSLDALDISEDGMDDL